MHPYSILARTHSPRNEIRGWLVITKHGYGFPGLKPLIGVGWQLALQKRMC